MTLRTCSTLWIGGLLLAAGCAPDSAEITTGSFTALLAISTSQTLAAETLDLDAFAEHWQVDCRLGIPEEEELENAIDVCNELDRAKHEQWLLFDGFEVVREPLEPWRGEAIVTSEGDLQLTFHNRLPGGEDFRFAFVVDPGFQPTECRLGDSGESESRAVDGDWVGNWSTGKSDYLNEAGEIVPLSSLEDQELAQRLLDTYGPVEGTLFYLNAGSYQFNPSNLDDIWILPDDWLAGYGAGKFAAEELFLRPVRYGKPAAYADYELVGDALSARDLFWTAVESVDGGSCSSEAVVGEKCSIDDGREGTCTEVEAGLACYVPELPAQSEAYQDLVADVAGSALDATDIGIAGQIQAELALAGVHDPEAGFVFQPRVEVNEWRLPDNNAPGLDGWMELHYSWVRFDQAPGELVVGNAASGDFQLVLDSGASQSRVFITGTFTVDEIEKDKWTVQNLTEEKLEEYGTELCGE